MAPLDAAINEFKLTIEQLSIRLANNASALADAQTKVQELTTELDKRKAADEAAKESTQKVD